MHPLLKPHILFHSDGLPIWHGLPEIWTYRNNFKFALIEQIQGASFPETLQFVL